MFIAALFIIAQSWKKPVPEVYLHAVWLHYHNILKMTKLPRMKNRLGVSGVRQGNEYSSKRASGGSLHSWDSVSRLYQCRYPGVRLGSSSKQYHWGQLCAWDLSLVLLTNKCRSKILSKEKFNLKRKKNYTWTKDWKEIDENSTNGCKLLGVFNFAFYTFPVTLSPYSKTSSHF